MPRLLLPALLVAIGLCASCKPKPAPTPPPPPPVSYTNEIRPLLAAKCLHCHGAFAAANTSGLRLDTAAHATTVRPASGAAPIVPGNPANSSLLQKLFVSNPNDEQQPDPAHTVTADEHTLLKSWIHHGAPYQPHWAHQPLPAEIPLPSTDSSWPRSPLDHFVLANLHGASPAPASTPLDWLHRTALDLTGYPPSPKVLTAFEQALPDNEGKAMWEATDQLLASPAFGEHLATRWLQTARYSDFLTPEIPNGQWPYRNWVIDAFNRNLPYNDFLTEQLAGDLLPNPTRDQQLATAFLRIHPLSNSSSDPLRDSTAKRTESFARSILALDLRCAKCHDHPYDPLTPTDYNSLLAFFHCESETGLPPAPGISPSPTVLLPTVQQSEKLYRATQTERAAFVLFRVSIPASQTTLREWLKNPDKLPLISDLTAAFSFDDGKDRTPNSALGAKGHSRHPGLAAVPGLRGKALQLDGKNTVVFPDLPPFTRSHPWTISLWLNLPAIPESPVTLLTAPGAFDLSLRNGQIHTHLYREWPGNALGSHTTTAPLTPSTWHLLTVSYTGTSNAAGLSLHLDGQPLDTTVTANHIWKNINETAPLQIPADPGLKDVLIDDLQIFARDLTTIEIANLHNGRALSDAIEAGDPDPLYAYYSSSIHPDTRQHQRKLLTLREAVVAAELPILEVSTIREPSSPSETRATPAFLPPLNSPSPNRLTLAKSLTHPSHPLTTRVYVNRLWANFFGTGLVASTENLGLHSAPNSNPALLDWLSRDFIEHGWNTKRLCRQIVLSAAYRQRSSQSLDPIRFRDRALAAANLPGSATAAGDLSRSLYTAWLLPKPSTSPSLCPSSPTAPSPIPSPTPLTPSERSEVAKVLATAALQLESKTDTARLTHLFQTLIDRPPSTNELASLGNTLRQQKSLLANENLQTNSAELSLWTKITEIFLNSPSATVK